MEDALVPNASIVTCVFSPVLILVLMEDALVPVGCGTSGSGMRSSLNPCFNGRCTRTIKGPLLWRHF